MKITERADAIQRSPLPIALITLAALWLRWPYPEPAWTHIDERAFTTSPLGFWSADLNPHFFKYPTLQFYLSSAWTHKLSSGIARQQFLVGPGRAPRADADAANP